MFSFQAFLPACYSLALLMIDAQGIASFHHQFSEQIAARFTIVSGTFFCFKKNS